VKDLNDHGTLAEMYLAFLFSGMWSPEFLWDADSDSRVLEYDSPGPKLDSNSMSGESNSVCLCIPAKCVIDVIDKLLTVKGECDCVKMWIH